MLAVPAGAVAPTGCKASVTGSAEIGMFPAVPGSQSALRVACVFDSTTGSSQVSAKYTIHDFATAEYHNGAARTISPNAAVGSGATTFTAANFVGLTAYVNHPISGTGIAARTIVKSISGAGLVTLNTATTAALTTSSLLKIDNTIARSVADGVTTVASFTVTSAKANFTAADIGLSLSGTNIPENSTIATVPNSTTVTFTNAGPTAALATGAAQTITVGASLLDTTTRTANDATYTAVNKVTSPAAKFKTGDVGLPVYGTGIAAGAYIISVAGSVATLGTNAVTVDALTHAVTVGDLSATAPTTGDTALEQGTMLDLNPSLVAGSGPCSDDKAEGFGIVGTWINPGAFVGGAFATQPTGTKAIGEFQFKTSVITYAAYVIERGPLTPSDPIGSAHYDIVFPNLPTTLALCASATSPGLAFSIGVDATTASQAGLASGIGKPSSAQLRSTLPSADGSVTATAYVVSDDGIHTWATADFSRLCLIAAGPPPVNFVCGD